MDGVFRWSDDVSNWQEYVERVVPNTSIAGLCYYDLSDASMNLNSNVTDFASDTEEECTLTDHQDVDPNIMLDFDNCEACTAAGDELLLISELTAINSNIQTISNDVEEALSITPSCLSGFDLNVLEDAEEGNSLPDHQDVDLGAILDHYSYEEVDCNYVFHKATDNYESL